MLSGVGQMQKDKSHIILLTCRIQKKKRRRRRKRKRKKRCTDRQKRNKLVDLQRFYMVAGRVWAKEVKGLRSTN